MISLIFPKQIDNRFRGHRLGLWLFGLFVAVKLSMGVNSILNTRSVATGADGIPLDSLAAGGAETVIRLFSMLALGQLALVVLGIVALVRYRAMIPLLYLLFLAEHLGRRLIAAMHPVEREGGSQIGLYINLTLLAVLLVGFALSLLTKPQVKADGAG